MANSWWVVYYEPIGTRSPGTAASLYQIIQASSQKAAEHAVQQQGAAVTNASGPYATQNDAQHAATGSSANTTTPGAPNRASTSNVGASGGADVNLNNPLSTLEHEITEIWDFIEKLGERSTWVRIGEFLAGGVLILVCMKVLASETKTGQAIQASAKSAAKIAKKVGEVAAVAAA